MFPKNADIPDVVILDDEDNYRRFHHRAPSQNFRLVEIMQDDI